MLPRIIFISSIYQKMFSLKFYSSSSSLSCTSTLLIIITIIFWRIRLSSTILFGGVKMVPKFLPRVVAGFYSLHPAYESDIPAPIASISSPSSIRQPQFSASTYSHHKNNYQYIGQQQQQKIKHRHKVKYRKPNYHKQNQYRPSNYHMIRLNPHIVDNYMLIAKQLAIHYGTKYQYPVDILYV
ncbi:hypothetical protein DERP_014435 [Dermatophagoides pteronyssinus]|uniref:Uncharacterized protein n=1 Tax=Dermatophagoides pteronyssinus TaxID=6956 RepID=A0ABQ8IVV3_DERPT|nr:hypothetical protein DERP_014435 [Dermatophagoides pteronyssinus]